MNTLIVLSNFFVAAVQMNGEKWDCPGKIKMGHRSSKNGEYLTSIICLFAISRLTGFNDEGKTTCKK